MMPVAGDRAPEWVLLDQTGTLRKSSDYVGRKLVLYFYPKDNTSGCSSQAVAFNARKNEIEALGATILGVSRDSVKSHGKFAENLGLTFTLLSDPELTAINAYGVFQEKKMYGKPVMGVVRTTFIIDARGVVEKVFEKVKAAQNAEDVVKYLSETEG